MIPVAANSPHVAIACGGTGGHLFPGLAVARQVLARGASVTVLISPKEVDQQAVRSAVGLRIVTLPAVALQPGQRLAFIRGFWQSWRAARKLFTTHRPAAVLAMGGFTSAPPIVAARGVGARTFIHESNAIPGRANRWLARVVDQAFVGFAQAESRLAARQVTVTGTPVRAEFRLQDHAACRVALGLDASRPVMLVMGGSQGATGINDMMISALPKLARLASQWQWLHLAGPHDANRVRRAYEGLGLTARVHSFLAEMDLALGAASACVSRAGASSLAELAAVQLPALLVPLPTAADNHQWYNAHAFANSGAAQMIEQREASPEMVADRLRELVEEGSVRTAMKHALAGWHAPQSAGQIADLIFEALARGADREPTRLRKSAPRERPGSIVPFQRSTQA